VNEKRLVRAGLFFIVIASRAFGGEAISCMADFLSGVTEIRLSITAIDGPSG
jgi:hypothetical protein